MAGTRSLYFTERCQGCDGASQQTIAFVPDENKKSSFLLSNAFVFQSGTDNGVDANPVERSLSATISSCTVESGASREIFLFGGFELIANVNSLQVFVKRDENRAEEYLTTCKGIRARDLPDLENDQFCPTQANVFDWFKFVLASPGGAKPVYWVRLVLQMPASPSRNLSIVVVRTMKMKCRLDVGILQNAHNTNDQLSMQNTSLGMRNMNNLASMMSMMQNTRAGSGIPPAPVKTNQQTSHAQGIDNRTSIKESMTSMTNISSQQNINSLLQGEMHQKQDDNHIEMMSSFAELGMVLKLTQEQTRNSFEQMLSQMESRISDKLDILCSRLNAIEQELSLFGIETKGDV